MKKNKLFAIIIIIILKRNKIIFTDIYLNSQNEKFIFYFCRILHGNIPKHILLCTHLHILTLLN